MGWKMKDTRPRTRVFYWLIVDNGILDTFLHGYRAERCDTRIAYKRNVDIILHPCTRGAHKGGHAARA